MQGEDLTFHVITHGDDGVFWSVVQTATEVAAAEYGVTVNYIGSNNDAEAHSQAIEAAIAEGSDGIAISLGIHIVSRILPRDIPLLVPVLALAAFGIVAGIAYHLIVEKPLIRWASGWHWPSWPARRGVSEAD